jgi:hypothetical protein
MAAKVLAVRTNADCGEAMLKAGGDRPQLYENWQGLVLALPLILV